MPERIRVDAVRTYDRDRLFGDAGISLILAHEPAQIRPAGFMVHSATALAARGIDTVTFNFLYSEEARRVPDRNDKLEACWRKVIEAFRRGVLCQHPDRRKLVIGGKSNGGRIAAQVADANGDDIAGLVFLG
jgi:predicted alpha/beta-hydrolase family hydrolase